MVIKNISQRRQIEGAKSRYESKAGKEKSIDITNTRQ